MPAVVIAGSGIAGLFAALRCADRGWRVRLVTKQALEDSNTNRAQGGIAGILDKTDEAGRVAHVADTLAAGAGHCDSAVVESIVAEAGERIRDLIEIGVRFDQDESGDFDRAREGGHSQRIILHAKDATGKEIERALMASAMQHPRIELFTNHLAVDLILADKEAKQREVVGIWVLDLDDDRMLTFPADAVILATGGAGQLFRRTTNPSVATADGIAMALRAGARLRDMEFVQFHPTALTLDRNDPFLITEALRGQGAVLLSESELSLWREQVEFSEMNGTSSPHPSEFSFTKRHSELGSLATRDIVARAIDEELKLSGESHVLLVTEHLDPESTKARFPSIQQRLDLHGLELGVDPIPVVPAAHYIVGGIAVDESGRVLSGSNDPDADEHIRRLYAIGEVACTGMHGANRLASNSLLEAVVHAHRASEHLLGRLEAFHVVLDGSTLPRWRAEGLKTLVEHSPLVDDLESLQMTMSRDVGLVRSDQRLERAQRRIDLLASEVELIWLACKPSRSLVELRNMVSVSACIVEAAAARRQNLGLHYNKDHVHRSD